MFRPFDPYVLEPAPKKDRDFDMYISYGFPIVLFKAPLFLTPCSCAPTPAVKGKQKRLLHINLYEQIGTPLCINQRVQRNFYHFFDFSN